MITRRGFRESVQVVHPLKWTYHSICYKKNSIEFVIILVMALFLQTLGAVLHLLVPIRVLYLVSAVAKDPFDQI